MAIPLQHHRHYGSFNQIQTPSSKSNFRNRTIIYPIICMTQQQSSSNDDGPSEEKFRQQSTGVAPPPAAQFAPLASTFQRRLLTGVASSSLVALGANFAGITSFLLGLAPEAARSLKLDVLYPIQGFSRCKYEEYQGFEFIYPANWVGDQTLLYRAASKLERYLGGSTPTSRNNPRRNINEPVVAFGPPGSSGELNVSVIVSPVPTDFSDSCNIFFDMNTEHYKKFFTDLFHRIEAFGGPKEVGEALIKTITGKRPNVKGTLVQSSSREDSKKNVKYYSLEFQVESPTFQRHNVAVFCATGGRLFTLNAQAPESLWPNIKSDMYRIADSFTLT
ncbi:OLC1v1000409C2 [Oldenlandia corymbosa var. corymbosa]|uniref:OLC1v1000409C2 n=1 Tax=Oldenlandia corymbosa var. corymbosa TaxID=529605 RepID=A0AAV1D3R8_OLDCO|nr:OLC1v1000409C2 [Oldenlandia corymbosa var. corymbosa]